MFFKAIKMQSKTHKSLFVEAQTEPYYNRFAYQLY